MLDRSADLRTDDDGDGLAYQAMLYASGELTPAAAAAFERRLGEDQHAREALAQAVELSAALTGEPVPQPDPAYRQRVRQRLGVVTAKRRRRWLAAVGGVVAATAATLLVLALNLPQPVLDEPAPPAEAHPEATVAAKPDTPRAEEEPLPEEAARMAEVWVDLPKGDSLARAREEELRRKHRVEEQQRTNPKMGMERSRILGRPTNRD